MAPPHELVPGPRTSPGPGRPDDDDDAEARVDTRRSSLSPERRVHDNDARDRGKSRPITGRDLLNSGLIELEQ